MDLPAPLDPRNHHKTIIYDRINNSRNLKKRNGIDLAAHQCAHHRLPPQVSPLSLSLTQFCKFPSTLSSLQLPWDFYLGFSFLVRVEIGLDAVSLTPDYHLTAILVQKLVDLRFFKVLPWTVVVVVFVFYELRPLNAKPTS